MYKTILVDAKSEFARGGQKLAQRSECKKEKICSTVKQLHVYIFICRQISFQASFCMLIIIRQNNIDKIFLQLNVHLSTL